MDYHSIRVYELIDRFLNDKLSVQEKVDFKKHLSEEEGLRIELEKHQLVNAMVVEQELADLSSKIKAVDFNKPPATPWSKITLSFTVVVGMAVFTFFMFQSEEKHKTIVQNETVAIVKPKKHNSLNNIQVDQNLSTKVSPIKTEKKTPVELPNDPPELLDPILAIIQDSTLSHKELISRKDSIQNEPEKDSVWLSAKDNISVEERNEEFNCELDKVTFRVTTTPACEDDSKLGVIKFTEINGKGPFQIFLNEELVEETRIEDLDSDIYNLQIEDSRGCKSEVVLSEIVMTSCLKQNLGKIDDAFSPSNGQTWDAPINNDNAGELTIYNKSYEEVTEQEISSGDQFEWNGTNLNGEFAPVGVYIVKIQYTNGSVIVGTIEIL